jgi:hypothetical protein
MTVGTVVVSWAAPSGNRPFQTFADEPKAIATLRAANDLEHTRLGQATLRIVSGGRA